MGKHNAPNPSQLAEDRVKNARANKNPIQIYSDPLYRIMWTRKTKKSEFTNIFFLSFRVDTDTDKICDALTNVFGGSIDKIIRWMYWYEIQLKENMTWGKIINYVNRALDGVVFDVIG